jgi:hypothetical protein
MGDRNTDSIICVCIEHVFNDSGLADTQCGVCVCVALTDGANINKLHRCNLALRVLGKGGVFSRLVHLPINWGTSKYD